MQSKTPLERLKELYIQLCKESEIDNESLAAEDIRDQMDGFWKPLSYEDQQKFNAFAENYAREFDQML